MMVNKNKMVMVYGDKTRPDQTPPQESLTSFSSLQNAHFINYASAPPTYRLPHPYTQHPAPIPPPARPPARLVVPFACLDESFANLSICLLTDHDPDQDELDSDDEYAPYGVGGNHVRHMDTQRVEEIPAKEPKPNAVPLKSALKKKGGGGMGGPNSASTPVTPTQEHSAAAAAAIANSNGGIGSMAAAAAAAAQQSASQRPLVVRQDATGNNYSLK